MDAIGRLNIGFIGIVVVVIVAIVIAFAVIRPSTPSSDASFVGPYGLKERNSAVKASDFGTPAQASNFLKAGAASFSAFVYLDTMSKTGEYVACGSAPNQPSCDSGVYSACACESIATCNNCSHAGYKVLFSLYDVYVFEVLNVPDASRPNAVAAQLTVLTTQNTTSGKTLYKETLSLKALPLQKWVMVSVVHDGRRIDVYYNDSLVSSATLENIPTVSSLNGSYVEVGDTGLTGAIGCLRFYGSTLNSNSVQGLYNAQIDTRGAPIELDTEKAQASAAISKAAPGSMLERMCLDGSCLSGGTFRMPTVSFGVPTEKPLTLGSISSIYAVESPYA